MTFDLPKPVDLAIPFFIVLMLAEQLWIRFARTYRGHYEWRDTATSLLMGFGNSVTAVIFGGAVGAMAGLVHRYQLVDLGWGWWVFALCFVLDDFAYYVFHRTAHRVRWFWASHVNHHTSQHYNLSTALRQTWTGFIALGFVFRLPLFLVFPPEMVFFCAGLNLVYQFWIHTEAVRRFPPWFEAVMNTPSHHRVHHATNPRYLDKNYAGVFIIWDKWLGTFEPERDDEPCRYGIVKNLGTFNLFWVSFHEWIGIAKDVWQAPTWRDKWRYMTMPPGWSHDGSRDTSETIKARWAARQGSTVAQAAE
jgi:sterol desaturase/sphingolipid hydroxylase (fatty acid hydroxylase superfamily)